MTRKLRFISDSGHGWLEVDKKDLALLGIKKDISYYSYQKGSKAYLEEDCDYPIFISAAVKRNIKIEIDEIYVNGNSWIRDCPCYRG